MKNTRTRILETALQLFNEQGLSQVTLRTIAQALGMSQGNLNYHFKKREEIIEALYLELVAKMDANMQRTQSELNHLKIVYEGTLTMMRCFYEYRFFMLDFVQIMREETNIRAHYIQLRELRKMQFEGLFQVLIQAGLMREKELEDEYENLYIRMAIMGDFWISSAITTQDLSPDLIGVYGRVLLQEFYPYLTEKGKREFLVLNFEF